MFWILISCIFTLLILLNELGQKVLRPRHPYRRVRQPPGSSIVGGIVMSFLDVPAFINIVSRVMNYFASPLKLWVGDFILVVHDPKQIKEVLDNPNFASKGMVRKLGKEWLGKGLIMTDVPSWKVQRKIMHTIFAARDMSAFSDIVNKHTMQFIKKMDTYLNGREFNVMDQTLPFSFGITCEDVLGVELSDEQRIFYYHTIKSVMETTAVRLFRIWYSIDIFDKLSSLRKEEMRGVELINQFTISIIQERKTLLKQKYNESSNAGRQKPVLDILLENQSTYTDEELQHEMNSMILAGFETTGTGLALILFLLANHPDIQDKVYNELHEIYGSCDPEDAPTIVSDIPKLEYLNRVIKESLRILPTVGMVTREITAGTKLGDETYWKPYTVFLYIIYMHRCAEYWPNPLDFEPDRFLPGHRLACRNPQAYVPFGIGPRSCIGKKIATVSLTTILATILRKYNFKTNRPKRPADLKLKIYAATIPAENIMLTVERRVAKKESSVQ